MTKYQGGDEAEARGSDEEPLCVKSLLIRYGEKMKEKSVTFTKGKSKFLPNQLMVVGNEELLIKTLMI